MKRQLTVIVAVGLLLGFVPSAQATLVLHWDMNNPTPTDDSTGTNDLVPQGGTTVPTHLATGGVLGSGAYQFDGTDDYFKPTTIPTLPNTPVTADWTASFWIKTTDTGTSTAYAGTPHLPVLGDQTGAIVFGLGVHGGTAAFRHYNAGWTSASGSVNVADGIGHYVTFIHNGGANTVDIYVDGVADTLGQGAGVVSGSPYEIRDVGRSYFGGGLTALYANMTLDDVRLYNTALTAGEVFDLFSPPIPLVIPEPSTWVLLGLGALGLVVYARRRK